MNIIILLIYTLTPLLIIKIYEHYGAARKIGTVMLAYMAGIILSVIQTYTPVNLFDAHTHALHIQSVLTSITIPLAIPLMLFGADFRVWTRSLPKATAALIAGIIAICAGVIISYWLFRYSHIAHIDTLSAMMAGIYTGGTMNFFALANILNVPENEMVLLLTFEMIITFPYLLFILSGGYKLIRRILPYPLIHTDSTICPADISVENYKGMLQRHTFYRTLTGLGLSVGCMLIGAGLSWAICGRLNELIIILTITTLAIVASFFPSIRALPKTFELGMYFILIFSMVVASQFNFSALNGTMWQLPLFILCILIITLSTHCLLCKMLKVNGDLFTVASIGLLCSPPFVPPVAGAIKNRQVLLSGIAIGLAGYALGTYLGIGLKWLLTGV